MARRLRSRRTRCIADQRYPRQDRRSPKRRSETDRQTRRPLTETGATFTGWIPPILTDRFDDTLAYASRLHRTQIRKGSVIPYVSHLLAVAAIALENGADEDQAIAALLHDAFEDQGGLAQIEAIRARFGEDVAQIVADYTDAHEDPKPAWHPRKQAYIARLAHSPARSLTVSLADKTHNAGAISAELRAHGAAVWSRFGGGKGGTLWYDRALATAFREKAPGIAAERFAREVDEMEELATRF